MTTNPVQSEFEAWHAATYVDPVPEDQFHQARILKDNYFVAYTAALTGPTVMGLVEALKSALFHLEDSKEYDAQQALKRWEEATR